MTFPTSFRIAQAIGIGGAAWLSGNIAALSLISVPALTATKDTIPTSTLTQQWHALFSRGKAQNPPVAAVVAASFAYLAYSVRPGAPLAPLVSRSAARVYGTAAVLSIGIVPFTILFMGSTNGNLIARVEGKITTEGKEAQGEVKQLLQKWTGLNGVRSLMPLAAATLGFVAALS